MSRQSLSLLDLRGDLDLSLGTKEPSAMWEWPAHPYRPTSSLMESFIMEMSLSGVKFAHWRPGRSEGVVEAVSPSPPCLRASSDVLGDPPSSRWRWEGARCCEAPMKSARAPGSVRSSVLLPRERLRWPEQGSAEEDRRAPIRARGSSLVGDHRPSSRLRWVPVLSSSLPARRPYEEAAPLFVAALVFSAADLPKSCLGGEKGADRLVPSAIMASFPFFLAGTSPPSQTRTPLHTRTRPVVRRGGGGGKETEVLIMTHCWILRKHIWKHHVEAHLLPWEDISSQRHPSSITERFMNAG
uniref:Uncharacterized protein n=1 Tax=Sphaerodactylus townsendi TaxID=933632 RepID=A0ACB8FSY7_9SAUR